MPRDWDWDRIWTLATGAGLTLAVLVVAAVVFVASGFYNVSANRKHFDVTTWLLDVLRRQSVRTHTIGLRAPDLSDPEMIMLGAAHFAGGCAACHGSPASAGSPLAAAMLPEPPSLDRAALDWSSEQLFWIVQQGQKYTGMPHWIAPEREDEVWAVTAFLKRLPGMDAATYAELASGGAGLPSADPGLEFGRDGNGRGVANCARCHGEPGQSPPSALVPLLSGQKQAYLERSLREYASGKRQSGVMQLVASGLDDEQIRELAARYAAGGTPAVVAGTGDLDQLERGAQIVAAGVPEADVPPCIACHGSSSRPPFPRIAGQSARYIQQQLQLWKRGLRRSSDFGAIMSVIAQRLTDSQIADVAAYLQSVPAVGRTSTSNSTGTAP